MKTSVYFNRCKKKANPSDQRKHNVDIPNCQNLLQSIHAGVLTLRQSSIQCVSCFLPRSSHLSGIICNHLVWAPYSSFKNFKLLPNLTQVTFSETGFLYCDFQTKAVTDLHIPACIPIDYIEEELIQKRGKGRRCCLGDSVKIPCHASYFAPGRLEEKTDFVLLFQLSFVFSSV